MNGPLLGQRAAVIFLLGILAALAAGVLTAINDSSAADAILIGGVTFAGAVAFFHSIIE
ncbi:hypothetical protein [Streptomyces sp. NPDC008141]|uniref:hypothetical protein n=1 Tax=Streptomyces sp. NPDC008141 TaxID=3364815 RepID=UPI0036F06EF4